jgi:hypothetical protein
MVPVLEQAVDALDEKVVPDEAPLQG